MNGLGGVLLKESIGFNYKILGHYALTSKLCLRRVTTVIKVPHANKRATLSYEEPHDTILCFPFG